MVAEIISTVERRRRWPTEVKLRILAEALSPGATVAAVADRNGVSRSLLYVWLRLARDGRMPGISVTPTSATPFVPVRIEGPVKTADASLPTTAVPAIGPSRRRPGVVFLCRAPHPISTNDDHRGAAAPASQQA